MTSAFSQDLFQRNLNLLGQIYPQYTEQIRQAAQQATPYTLEWHPEKYFTCYIQTQGEPVWIHGPDNPLEHAKRVIQDSGWDTLRQFIILRPSLGYFPFTLYPNLRKGRYAQRMLLVEDRIDLFVESLKRFDWTDILRSDRTILLLSDNPREAVFHFVQTNPVAILPPAVLMCGCNQRDEEHVLMQQLRHLLADLLQTVNQAAQQYLDEMEEHYAQVQSDPGHRTKVLLINPEHDYLADSIEAGFRQQGCEAVRFSANQRLVNYLNPFIWLSYTRENLPDVMFWMNRNTLSPEGKVLLDEYPIKKVLWYMDNPKRVEADEEELLASDAVFSFDPVYLPYLQELGGKEVFYLPNGAGLEPLPECAPSEPGPQRQGPPVSFVGALAASRFQEVRRFWLERDADFVAALDGIVDDYLQDSSLSLEERYEQSPASEHLPYSGFVVLYLEERVTYSRRLTFLQAIADQNLATYGTEEWANFEWAGELAANYSGQTPKYREELPGVYYHSHINLNVFHAQCINSTNPRVYDVLASGGFLLSEYRPAIEDEFEIGVHLDCFHTREELREKIEYYKTNPVRCNEMARAGQQFVLNNATYAHRVAVMMRHLYSRGNSPVRE